MTVVAAIDCGTNSTRLLVSEVGADTTSAPRPLERLMRITRLGFGVDATGRLDPSAIDRTVAVLAEYRAVMDRYGVERVRMTATSAARDASNRDEFFGPAEAAVGVRPELLSGDEEGRLSFAGATADLDSGLGPFLVVDIGGGSTEFVVGESAEAGPSGVLSIDVGSVRITEKFLHHDPPTAEELSQAISVVSTHVEEIERLLPAVKEAATFVGLAGTVTTIAAVEIGLPAYDRDRLHHFTLTRTAAEDVFRTLATESRADRVHNPGLEEARADVIVGGAAVLVAIMRRLDRHECLVSEADILDGLIASLA